MDQFSALRDWLEELPAWQRGELKQFESAVFLSSKLWGSPENLKRQLEAPTPQVPAGLDRKGLLTLKTKAWLAIKYAPAGTAQHGAQIIVGDQRFSLPEARYEIARRALAALGGIRRLDS
jgi:hypothetical protein